MKLKNFALIVITTGFLGVVFLMLYGHFRSQPVPLITSSVSDLISVDSHELIGWRVEDLPISGDEKYDERTFDVLRFDDFIYRKFTRNNLEFAVYLVYWKPNSMSPREVNTHNPDACWVSTGWELLEKSVPYSFSVNGHVSPEGEWASFAKGGVRREVYFLHLVGWKPYSNRYLSFRKKLDRLFMEPIRNGFVVKQEQVYLRIETANSLNSMQDVEAFRAVVGNLLRSMEELIEL